MVRRIVDMVAAGLALVVLAPVLAVVAIVVLMGMGGPVLFTQERSGLRGRPFTIYKFRTMQPGGGLDADRTPPIGALLRTLSLDELPQLWNVLRGDMALVGPRPTLPEQVARYGSRERRRLEVRPGITGWAQVRGRNALSWPERIELDIWYIDHRSLRLDLRIVVLTILRLVRPSGIVATGGVNPGFPTPMEVE